MRAAIAAAWALLLGVALLQIGNGLQGTLLGVRAQLEGFPTVVTGILMSGYYAGFLAGSTLAPRLVARVGHVRVFAALASLASTAILIHALLVNPATWVAIRLVTGFCYAGLFVVAESWLNEQSSNQTRGQMLSVYMVASTGGLALGQALLNAADPGGTELFILVSILVSLALIPILLAEVKAPPFEAHAHVGIRELYRISPLGLVGVVTAVMAYGAFFGMGPVYGATLGLSVREISTFMGLTLLGGVVLQFPIGRLSDRFDRRRVITATAFLAALAALVASLMAGWSEVGLLLAIALLGGAMIPMYSLSVAHTNDFLEHRQIVEASGTLMLVAGIGASFGPVSASLAMELVGPNGLFWWIAILHAVLGGFALWRMTQRPAKPLEEQGAFVAMAPRATPTTTAMYSDATSGEPAAPEHQTAPVR